MKLGRFIVDTHVHPQRFAAGKALKQIDQQSGQPESAKFGGKWEQLSHTMADLVPYDNTDRLLYDMECYDVDMCVLLPAFGMTDEINMQITKRYPDKSVAECDGHAYMQQVRSGEIEWSIDGVCAALDQLLSTGKFVGIGEISPCMPQPPDPYEPISRETAVTNMLAILQVARRHKVSVRIHSGCTMGYDVPYSTGGLGPFNYNPLWVHDLASVFPDVPLIIDHGGVQGWWSEKLQRIACTWQPATATSTWRPGCGGLNFTRARWLIPMSGLINCCGEPIGEQAFRSILSQAVTHPPMPYNCARKGPSTTRSISGAGACVKWVVCASRRMIST
jgi:hypothetical protein